MPQPSIKGLSVQLAVERIREMLAVHQLKTSDLESVLHECDHPLIEDELVPALWYPIDGYDRLLQVLRDFDGAGRDQYLVWFGRSRAERVIGAPGARRVVESAERLGERMADALVGVGPLLLNFGKWAATTHTDRIEVQVTSCAALPRTVELTAVGFIEAVVEQVAGEVGDVSSERPSPDHWNITIRLR